MKAYAPNGKQIVGIVETIILTAFVDKDRFQRLESGAVAFSYSGEYDFVWDSHAPILEEDGQRVFIDEDGKHWREDQIEMRP